MQAPWPSAAMVLDAPVAEFVSVHSALGTAAPEGSTMVARSELDTF
jgi:hypothetical protein